MANVQTSKGFTKIANELYDAIIRWHFSGYEFRILIFLIRKTYGWNKKTDWISLSQFHEGTKIQIPHICRAISLLVKQNIITKGGNRNQPMYGIQKDYELWMRLPKGVRSHHELKGGNSPTAKGGNPLVQKGADTKDTLLTKETITKEREQVKINEGLVKIGDILKKKGLRV